MLISRSFTLRENLTIIRNQATIVKHKLTIMKLQRASKANLKLIEELDAQIDAARQDLIDNGWTEEQIDALIASKTK